MLATLALFVTGVAVLLMRRRRRTDAILEVDGVVLSKDVRYFALSYTLAIAVAFTPTDWWFARPAAAVLLIALYVIYVRIHLQGEVNQEGEGPGPLRFHRLDPPGRRVDPAVPRLRVISLQVLIALACIIGGALVFVRGVEHLSVSLGVAPIILALVIAPIATELPEKANSVLWVRQNKDTLAMGNITGAMVFQSTIPTVVALVFASDSWVATEGSYLVFASAGMAFLSAAVIFIPMARRHVLHGRVLLVGGAFYLAYLGLVVGVVSGAIGGGPVTH
jgi:cation:H+ antiporter